MNVQNLLKQRDMNPKIDLLYGMNRFPPFLVRTLARSRGRNAPRIPDSELAKRTSWTPRKIRWISEQTVWDKLVLEDAVKFAGACGVNLARLNWLKRVFKKELSKRGTDKPFDYLTLAEMTRFNRLLESLPPKHPLRLGMK